MDKEDYQLDMNNIPAHIAFIMDGNGRWAKKRMMPRTFGHNEGTKTIRKVALEANRLGVKAMTVYAFSTENFARPEEEVQFIFKLPKKFFESYLKELIENNVQICMIGHLDKAPKATRDIINSAIEQTKNNTGLKLCFAFIYGGRDEIVHSTKQIVQNVQEGKISIDDITEDYFNSTLMSANLPDVDLMIRTSGEQRLSNFMLWQLAYAEFIFTPVYWPDFDEKELHKSIWLYQNRERRYGGLKERIITALCLIAVVVPAVVFGGIFYKILIAVVMGLSIYEMLHICSRPRIGLYMYFLVGAFFVGGFLLSRDSLLISNYLLLVYMACVLACMIFDEKCNIERAAYVFTMGTLVCAGCHALLVMRLSYGWEYLLLLAIATFGSDTGAYFTGMAIGKHKLIPRLSPKKTIEGSIGGIILGSVLGLIFAYFTGILAKHWIIVPAVIVMTLTGQIGDLIFSAIKRYFEVKDYSKLLPGHGGILDRIDSLTYNVLIFSFFLMIVGL